TTHLVIDTEGLRAAGTSAAAVTHHYDLSDEFFSLWLGPDLVYSCALWDPGDPGDDLSRAQRRKLDFFATQIDVSGSRVLDIGCGWGGLLAHLVSERGLAAGVGLTLSPGQAAFATERNGPGVDFRVERWGDHEQRERE